MTHWMMQTCTRALGWTRTLRAAAAGLALVLLAAACGFQLRGETPLPFQTLYVGVPQNSKFGANLRRAIRAASPHTELVEQAPEAQVILQQVAGQRSIQDTSINSQGRVEEYELSVRFTFRLIDPKGNAVLPDVSFSAYRQMPYNDQVGQALSSQMETLFVAMEQSLIDRVLRRMAATDVRDNYAKLHRGEPDPSLPVFNPPPAKLEPELPPAWTSPTNNLGAPPR